MTKMEKVIGMGNIKYWGVEEYNVSWHCDPDIARPVQSQFSSWSFWSLNSTLVFSLAVCMTEQSIFF